MKYFSLENMPTMKATYGFLGAAFFLLVVSFVYSPVTTLGFSLPDDHWMLLKNEYVHPEKYNWEYFKTIFSRISNIQYSPLNTLFYCLIFKINGFDPYYFHLANVVIHIINSLLVFKLAQHLLTVFSVPNKLFASYIVALFWSIHPMHVEVVAWVSGSKILLCTLFTLVSFNQFILGVVTKKVSLYLLSILCFVVSFYFKEQAIITPVMFLLLLIFYKLQNLKKIRFTVIEITFLFVMFGLTILFGLYTIHVNYARELDFPPINYYPLTQRVILIAYCLFFYFSNLIVPRNLKYHQEFPFSPYETTPDIFAIYAFIMLVAGALIVYLILRSKDRWFYAFCFLVALAQLSLELQIIPMTRPAMVADRYMYFPAITLLLALIPGLMKFRKIPIARFLYRPLGTAYLIYFILYSNQMANYWHNLNLIK